MDPCTPSRTEADLTVPPGTNEEIQALKNKLNWSRMHDSTRKSNIRSKETKQGKAIRVFCLPAFARKKAMDKRTLSKRPLI